jgi:hypothetical protein
MYQDDYTAYQLNRSWLRKCLRKLYLYHTASFAKGACIDFGCGVGELLKILPVGSVGLDANRASVSYCQRQGLRVYYVDPEDTEYRFQNLPDGDYGTLIMNHVLEHLGDSANRLRSLLESCDGRGIERVIIVVPGEKGFAFDKTHLSFVNEAYFRDNRLREVAGYRIAKSCYFPLNIKWLGKLFVYHELLVLYERPSTRLNGIESASS